MQESYHKITIPICLVCSLDIEFVAIAICTLTDLVTLPLMTAQSRLVLQHSSSHFRSKNIDMKHINLQFPCGEKLLGEILVEPQFYC